MIKYKNLIAALKGQLPWKRAFRNFVVTRNAWGMFSKYSHMRRDTGKFKEMHPTLERATKAAESMSKKKGVHFSVYKCIYCDGWHLGKNRENK
jgi:uroporphyrinogen-III decarboxylase